MEPLVTTRDTQQNNMTAESVSGDIADNYSARFSTETLVDDGTSRMQAGPSESQNITQGAANSAVPHTQAQDPQITTSTFSGPPLQQAPSVHSRDNESEIEIRQRTTWPRNEGGTYLPTRPTPVQLDSISPSSSQGPAAPTLTQIMLKPKGSEMETTYQQ